MQGDITALLKQANDGVLGAEEALWSAVHEELRTLAHRHMEREWGRNLPGVTLQPTALVNEAYIQLIKQRSQFDNRGHFFAIATKVLIRVLRDYERERTALKRGGGWVRVTLDPESKSQEILNNADDQSAPIEKLVDALNSLETLDARKAEVVKLRVLWGLTIDETAKTLCVGHATIERDWEFSRAWLRARLAG